MTEASTGGQALDALRSLVDVDLLFTDIIMPGGINGRQLAVAVQKLRPEIKTLFTSGYPEKAVVHHGRLDEGARMLSKPYRRHDMAAKVRSVLDGVQHQKRG